MNAPWKAALGGALAALSSPADAPATGKEDPAFGPNDVHTVFFIAKSDDKNRVDYGLRLDDACVPVGNDPVFPYWREFENSPPVRTHSLKWFEFVAYGVKEQKLLRKTATGAELAIHLKPLPRELIITTERGPDGRCRAIARATVAGVPDAEIISAYVKLKRAMSVEYVEIYGKHPKTGEPLTERLNP